MRTVLTIAGSDPTGGAGVQADLQVISSLGCHGAGVITSLTVQDTRGVHAVHHLPPELVRDQLTCLLDDVPVSAAKTGMLGEAGIVGVVSQVLGSHASVPLIVDPVLASTGGCPLLDAEGLAVLRRELLPRAALVTPNLAEAEALTGMEVRSVSRMREAAKRLVAMGAAAALVKGGHLPGDPVDVLCIGDDVWELRGERVQGGPSVHGTGCALSAAAAAFVARGEPLHRAVERAKAYVTAAIAAAHATGSGAMLMNYRAAAKAVDDVP